MGWRVRGAWRTTAWLLLLAWQTASIAAGSGPAITLPDGAVELAEESLVIDGRATDIRLFEAPGPLARVADAVAAQGGPGTVLAGLPDGVLISGTDGNALWAVRLRMAGDRVAGRLSRRELRQSVSAAPSPRWLPAAGRMHLDVLSREGGTVARQRIYAYAESPARLRSMLRRRLASDKWRELSVATGFAEWQRGHERLEWLVVPLRGGSGLIVHIQERPRP